MKAQIIPQNLKGKSLFDFLVKKESLIFHSKKSVIKTCDGINHSVLFVDEKGNLVDKAAVEENAINPDQIKVVVVINTTNWYDSHGDVHIPGIWKKTLSDNKKNGFYLLDNHNRGFEDVIAENCSAEAKSMSWKDLGVSIEGSTEALIFTGVVEKERNPKMFEQYAKKYVKKHSVGMRYIKMVTCINDDDYPVQKENWDKYFPMVANKDECEEDGYFWAVLEAQIIEGSAVLFGSNTVTPTLETINTEDDQPLNDTGKNQPLFIKKSIAICPNCCSMSSVNSSQWTCQSCGQFVSGLNQNANVDWENVAATIN